AQEEPADRQLPLRQVGHFDGLRRPALLGQPPLAREQADLVAAGAQGHELLVVDPRRPGPLVVRRGEVEVGAPSEGSADGLAAGAALRSSLAKYPLRVRTVSSGRRGRRTSILRKRPSRRMLAGS